MKKDRRDSRGKKHSMTLEEAREQIPAGRYRHFKGNEYEVLEIARHSETEEPMVVYRALYGEYGLWVRPAEMWTETVIRDGKTFRRFSRIPDGSRYVAFDVETPNFRNDRMSAIGITVVEEGEISEEFYSLVNPETHFDLFNTQLTGISAETVEGEPTFPELWEKIEPMLSKGILVAHNAPFDLSVLAKCLSAYRIPWKQKVKYACTVQMSRQMHPEADNHKLNTMCDMIGIELDHHHAGSDSRACGKILLRYLEEGMKAERFIRTYDMRSCKTLR